MTEFQYSKWSMHFSRVWANSSFHFGPNEAYCFADDFLIIILQAQEIIFPITLMISLQNNQIESPSKIGNRGELKKVEQDLIVAKNRVAALRQQLQKQKEGIKKNKVLTQQTIAKKLAVNSINSYRLKDNSEDIARIEGLKKRNHSMRLEHEKSLENIQKAIYLVKLDDAREVKNISEEHRRKIREMDNDEASKKLQKMKQHKEESEKAKQKYMRYWKDKLSSIYAQQALNAQEMQKSKEEKQRQLKNLEQEEIKLLEEINLFHSKNVQSKKEYVAALSLPVKEVAMAMGNDGTEPKDPMKKSGDYSRSKSMAQIQSKNLNKSRSIYGGQQNSSVPTLPMIGPKLKVPHASVNEKKLKIILQQLKRIDQKKRYDEEGPLTNKTEGQNKY